MLYGHKHKFKSAQVEQFCTSKENCRRKTLLSGVGCTSFTPVTVNCCDVCSPSVRSSASAIPKETRKRRRACRKLQEVHTNTLRKKLEEERECILRENPECALLGQEFICSTHVISKLCDNAKFYESREDVNVFGIVPEFRNRFLDVLFEVLCTCPCKRSCPSV